MKNTRVFSFRGGVHPPENKFSAAKRIETLPVPAQVAIPVIQHIGAPAKPLVAKGDMVKRWQKIAEAGGHVSAPIHASISGKVIDVIPQVHPVVGRPVDTIIIESDGTDESVALKSYADYFRFAPKALIEAVKEAGIVGLGGATFPTHVKLSPPTGTEIDTVIINGAECEPYLTADDRLMCEHPKEMVEGAKLIMYMLHAARVVIVVENNKPEAIKNIQKIVYNEPNIDVVALPVRYPQGAEKQLIKAVTNREVPTGGLPLQVGVVVSNVGTAYAINRALKEGEPLTERVVTVSGRGIAQPKNLLVRIGTPVRELIDYCGGYAADIEHLIMGGPMMGIAQITDTVPVLKGTSGILLLTKEETAVREYVDCFRCGKCVQVCPMGLFPNAISVYVQNDRLEQAQGFYPMDCVECGSCAYVCPAHRPLVQQIKWAKAQLNAKKAQKKN